MRLAKGRDMTRIMGIIIIGTLIIAGCANKEEKISHIEEREEYYLLLDGKEYGPVSLTTLKEWAREGRVLPDALIREGEGEYKEARLFKGLKAEVKGGIRQPGKTRHLPAKLTPDEEYRLKRDLENMPVYPPNDD